MINSITTLKVQQKQASFIVYLIAHRLYAIASSDVMEFDNFGQIKTRYWILRIWSIILNIFLY